MIMPAKKILYLLSAGGLVFLQLVLVGNFNFFSGRINLALVILIILVNLADFSQVAIFSVITGLLLDIYSGLPFGVMALALFLTGVILEILFLNFFTNFSFYSALLLSLIAVLIYNLVFLGVIWLIYFFGLSDYLPRWDYVYKIAWQIGTTEAIMVAAYYFINSLSKKFKPVFLG